MSEENIPNEEIMAEINDDEFWIPEGEGNPVGFTITTKEEYDCWLAMQGYYWVFPY